MIARSARATPGAATPAGPARRSTTAAAAVAAVALAAAVLPSPAAGAEPAAAPAVSERQEAAAEAARVHWLEHAPEILAEYVRFLELPNVASDLEGVTANARWITAALERRGARAELLELPGVPPLVVADLPATAGGDGEDTEPAFVLYAHYDGQPVVPERWTFGPWTPTLTTGALEAGGEARALPPPGEPLPAGWPDWRLYARGSGDDKVPIQAFLAAVDALEAAGIERTVDVRLVFEGEEEAGSPHLDRYLDRFADRFGGDAWLFLDGPVHQSGRPQLFFGVRGITTMELTVYGAERYLHSGHYGNWAPNPAMGLAHLLAGLKDEDGRVRVEGFYDSAEPVTPAERAALDAVPPFEAELAAELGLAATEGARPGEPVARYLDRLLLPSLNVRGLESASVGETARNVIPSTATASIDVRLVPGNDPEAMLDLVEAHIRSQGWHIVRGEPDRETRLAHPKLVRVEREPGYRSVRSPMDSPAAVRVIAAARLAAAGGPEAGLASPDDSVVLVPTLGGSLPLYLFADRFEAPIVGVPIANHDDNQHAPDENIRLGNLAYGVRLLAALLTTPAVE